MTILGNRKVEEYIGRHFTNYNLSYAGESLSVKYVEGSR